MNFDNRTIRSDITESGFNARAYEKVEEPKNMIENMRKNRRKNGA